MLRRQFLGSLAGAAASSGRAPARIARISFAPMEGRFHKFVAMNSYDTAPKGHTYSGTLMRVCTDQGVDVAGALLDRAGKLAGKPCGRRLGRRARERVAVYDGTLYFSDVWFPDRGV